MTRNRWTGVAGILFGLIFFAAGALAGSTPNSSASDAPARYLRYWTEGNHADRARLAGLVMTYVVVLLLAFAAGLRERLRGVDVGPLPSFVLAAGTACAVLIVAGAQASVAVGGASADTDAFKVDGNSALLFDHLGYGIMAPGLMAGAAMAVAVGLVTLRTRVLPAWTAWLGFLLGLGALGSFFTAWTGFFLLPIWSVAVGVCLLLRKDDVPLPSAPVRESVAA
ncbi:MAG: hypothetical protein LC789_18040 [Actinobacteria bacterium]|nr:hypothetical protein [Actinomycetota bacterium]MCA1722448.1 hypothetical protein [Actinomycetota bacterium]